MEVRKGEHEGRSLRGAAGSKQTWKRLRTEKEAICVQENEGVQESEERKK